MNALQKRLRWVWGRGDIGGANRLTSTNAKPKKREEYRHHLTSPSANPRGLLSTHHFMFPPRRSFNILYRSVYALAYFCVMFNTHTHGHKWWGEKRGRPTCPSDWEWWHLIHPLCIFIQSGSSSWRTRSIREPIWLNRMANHHWKWRANRIRKVVLTSSS